MKTEKEKMLAGEPYDCGDPELIDRWHKAKKQLQKRYNKTHNCFFYVHLSTQINKITT